MFLMGLRFDNGFSDINFLMGGGVRSNLFGFVLGFDIDVFKFLGLFIYKCCFFYDLLFLFGYLLVNI